MWLYKEAVEPFAQLQARTHSRDFTGGMLNSGALRLFFRDNPSNREDEYRTEARGSP